MSAGSRLPSVRVGQLVPRVRTEAERAEVEGGEADDQDDEHDDGFHDPSFPVTRNLFQLTYRLHVVL